MRDKRKSGRNARLVGPLALIAGMTAITATAAPVVASAPDSSKPSFTFDISIETPCVAGHGPANSPLTVTVRSAAGHALGAKAVSAAASGAWHACFSGLIVEPGMAVTAKHGSKHRRVTVPPLTLRTDRPSDVLSGRGPIGQALRLTLTRCLFDDPCLVKHYPETADSHGHYRDDVSSDSYPWDLQGGDKATIGFHTAAGDHFHADAITQLMRVIYPDRVVVQIQPPGTSVTARLVSSTGSLRAKVTRTSTVSGPYTFHLKKNGRALAIQPGDMVTASVAPDAKITWPHVRLVGHPASGRVTGTCLKDDEVQVTDARSGAAEEGTADSNGTFTLDFSTHGGIQHGDALTLICRADTGDRLEFSQTVS